MRRFCLCSALVVSACTPQPKVTASAAPEIKAVYVSIDGPFPLDVDLNQADERRVLPVAHTAAFKIQAKDDVTPVDALQVVVTDAAGNDVPDQLVTLRNGLWTSVLTVSPGMTFAVRVTDGEGQPTVFAHRLIIPSRADAIAGDWETRFFAVDKTLLTTWPATFAEDGSWKEKRATMEAAGTYVVEGDKLRVIEPGAALVEGNYYVDQTYLGVAPYVAAADTLIASWHRDADALQFTASPMIDPIDAGLTWDGTFAETTATGSRSGYYRVVKNDNYVANFGNFLHRRVTLENGVATNGVSFELFVLRVGHLLITPKLRAH